MTVRDLTSCYYDTVLIYAPCDEDFMEFEDLYKGKADNVPAELLNLTVRCFGAKRKGVIDISVRTESH